MVEGVSDGPVRREQDSMGVVEVPADRYWGAQTQRSREHFDFEGEAMPIELVHELARIKVAAARVNAELGVLDAATGAAIEAAAQRVVDGEMDDHFPLTVFQTGSGTQSNMNVNEVVANLAIEALGGELGARDVIHPNDHVNKSQSSNDTFPTAAHLAVAAALTHELLPVLDRVEALLADRAERWAGVVKLGRTHLQDAVPITVGQEWSGYRAMVQAAIADIRASRESVYELALGGTAVGTGLNAPPGFGERASAVLAELTGLPFRSAPNLFAALAGADGLVQVSGALRHLAADVFKIANDLRWLGSGPRGGIAELRLPENEPGSSIMPGKVNPTQAESLLMVSVQVMGNDTAVAFAASQGNFELNVMRPLLAANVLRSIHLLASGIDQFRRHLLDGVELDEDRIASLLHGSLMLVTALVPRLGYDRAAAVAHHAHVTGSTLREAAVLTGALSADEFDSLIDPSAMVGPRDG